MNTNQNQKYEMYERVLKLCNENETNTALIAAFQSDKSLLESVYTDIRTLSKRLAEHNALSDKKQGIKTRMLLAGVDICTNLKGYSILTKDAELLKVSAFTKSTLGAGKEEDVLQRCENIRDKAIGLKTELMAKRGMQASLLEEFTASITEFQAIKPAPRANLQEKSNLLTEMDNLFDAADTAFTLLTGSAVNFKTLAPNFLLRFNNATAIIAAPVSRTKVKIDAEHADTKEKLTGFTVVSQALSVNKSFLPDEKGTALNTVHHNEADLLVTCEGFESLVVPSQKIKKGRLNRIKVKMVPLKAN
jgi:hypothetical protein